MNVKNILTICCCAICMTMLSDSLAYSAQYYCESADFQGSYQPGASDCNDWGEKFGKDSDMYKSCLTAHSRGMRAFNSGKCDELLTKTHTFGSTSCVVQYTKLKRKLIGTSCSPDDYAAKKKIQQLYN